MLPRSKVKDTAVLMSSEVFYSLGICFGSWVIVLNLWYYSEDIKLFFDQCHHLQIDVVSIWPWVIKALAPVVPFVMQAILSSLWYIEAFNLTWSWPWGYVFEVSYFWLVIVGVVPITLYVLLAQIMLACLCSNNAAFTQAITMAAETDDMGNNQNENLRKIYEKSLTLRRLYKEMEKVLSNALLGSKMHMTISIVFNIFYIVYLMLTNHSWNYLFISVLPVILNLMIIVIMGRLADNITKAVSHCTVS